MSTLKLSFQDIIPSQNIDVLKLRPSNSYQDLLRQRLGPLHDILTSSEDLTAFLSCRNCPCCESDSFSEVGVKDRLSLVRCSSCSVIYVNPVFSQSRYHEHYQSTSYQSIVKRLGEDSHVYRLNRFGSERARFIDDNHLRLLPKTFLDIGCSTGFTVEALQNMGWSSEGLELNPSAARFASERNLNIYNIPIEGFSPGHLYSAIGLFDVLEHLLNPREILENIWNLLCPGGALYIYVPNWSSASLDILGIGDAHFVWPTHHLTYFTPQTISAFLQSLGFVVFHWETQGLDLYDVNELRLSKGEQPILSDVKLLDQLQGYINSSGHGKNLRVFCRKPL